MRQRIRFSPIKQQAGGGKLKDSVTRKVEDAPEASNLPKAAATVENESPYRPDDGFNYDELDTSLLSPIAVVHREVDAGDGEFEDDDDVDVDAADPTDLAGHREEKEGEEDEPIGVIDSELGKKTQLTASKVPAVESPVAIAIRRIVEKAKSSPIEHEIKGSSPLEKIKRPVVGDGAVGGALASSPLNRPLFPPTDGAPLFTADRFKGQDDVVVEEETVVATKPAGEAVADRIADDVERSVGQLLEQGPDVSSDYSEAESTIQKVTQFIEEKRQELQRSQYEPKVEKPKRAPKQKSKPKRLNKRNQRLLQDLEKMLSDTPAVKVPEVQAVPPAAPTQHPENEAVRATTTTIKPIENDRSVLGGWTGGWTAEQWNHLYRYLKRWKLSRDPRLMDVSVLEVQFGCGVEELAIRVKRLQEMVGKRA